MCNVLSDNLCYQQSAPITIDANKNDLSFMDNGAIIILDVTGLGFEITGFQAPQAAYDPAETNTFSGFIFNNSANAVKLKHNSGSSAVGNRIVISTALDLSLLAGEIVPYFYNGTSFKINATAVY